MQKHHAPPPPINPRLTAAEAWACTDHGALVDALGDVSHLAPQIHSVGLLHSDGSTRTLPTTPLSQRAPLRLVPAGLPHELAADPPAEMWHSPRRTLTDDVPARRSTPAFAAKPLPPARHIVRESHTPPRPPLPDDANGLQERVPTWLLAVGALVIVATIAISSLAPWGWALPL